MIEVAAQVQQVVHSSFMEIKIISSDPCERRRKVQGTLDEVERCLMKTNDIVYVIGSSREMFIWDSTVHGFLSRDVWMGFGWGSTVDVCMRFYHSWAPLIRP
ncbi:hypothetical protein Syun_029385 [Stephania yunnanensis]|uniref:Uncharacterized protein n=1 Tax=Stephania yunnanensis TaxID=152371 RepID=A0AAP0E5I6_9MAGN